MDLLLGWENEMNWELLESQLHIRFYVPPPICIDNIDKNKFSTYEKQHLRYSFSYYYIHVLSTLGMQPIHLKWYSIVAYSS